MKERNKIIFKLGEALNEFEIDADIEIVREYFYYLKESKIEFHSYIKIEKELRSDLQQSLYLFIEKAKSIVKNIENI